MYTQRMEYYSAIKKKGNSTICDDMGGPRKYHVTCNKTNTVSHLDVELQKKKKKS